MKKVVLIAGLIVFMSAFSLEPKNINVDYNFLFSAYKKEFLLKQKNPLYGELISTPSKRNIIDFNKKDGTDTIKVLVLKVEFLEDTTSLTTGNGKMDLRGSIDSEYEIDTVIEGSDTLIDTMRNLYYQPPHDSLFFFHQM